MLDATHKAVLVLFNPLDMKVEDVGVFIGPAFHIGHWAPNATSIRLLLAEIKTSDLDVTDRAVWHFVKKHAWVLRSDEQPHSIKNWTHDYEERQCRDGRLTLSECLVFGK